MRKWALIVVAAAAIIGSVISVISISQHLRISHQGFEEKSFCAISETIDCDIVNASSYSRIFGIPVAAWGLMFYVFVLGVSAIAYFSKKDRRDSVSFVWFMSIAGILYSAYLAYVAVAIIGVVCIECLAMYAANLIILIFLFAALNISIGGIPTFILDYIRSIFGRASNLEFKPNILRHVFAVVAVFLIGWIMMAAVQAKDRPKDAATVDEQVKAFYIQSLYSIAPDPEWPVWGNPEAKTTIIEFSEYQCPFCRVAAFNVKPYLQEFKKDLRFYFVNYPLDQACNEDLDHPMHEFACAAAKAGVCAQKMGDFWGYHDEVFKNQRKINDELLLDIAEKHGWNRDEFEACINSPEALARVKKDLSIGRKIYVNGTPSFFLNDRKLRYWSDPKFLQKIVKEEIKKAGKK